MCRQIRGFSSRYADVNAPTTLPALDAGVQTNMGEQTFWQADSLARPPGQIKPSPSRRLKTMWQGGRGRPLRGPIRRPRRADECGTPFCLRAVPVSSNCRSKCLPKRLELLLRIVLALPIASITGLVCCSFFATSSSPDLSFLPFCSIAESSPIYLAAVLLECGQT